jgi:hypothetical protein
MAYMMRTGLAGMTYMMGHGSGLAGMAYMMRSMMRTGLAGMAYMMRSGMRSRAHCT